MNRSRRWVGAAVCAAGTLVITRTAAVGEEAPAPKARQVDVCFVLDTTGSMGGLIEGAKRKIWSIANTIASARPSPTVRFGLIGYRDKGDEYVTRVHDMTDDLDAIYDKLQQFQANGGGDGPESVNQALNEAVTKMSWNTNRSVLKIVFLVGDAPPHMDYADDIKYPQTCELAVRNDLIVNTVQCGGDPNTSTIWKEIAGRAEGSFTAIGQTGDMVVTATPVDGEIASLSAELAGTRMGYAGGKGKFAGEAARASDMATAPAAPVGAERAVFLARKEEARERAYKAGEAPRPDAAAVIEGREELLSAIGHGTVKLDELEDDKLPEELRALDKDARRKFVEERLAKRKELQERLDALAVRRAALLKEAEAKAAQSGRKDGFDTEVGRIIREQGGRKGIVYE